MYLVGQLWQVMARYFARVTKALFSAIGQTVEPRPVEHTLPPINPLFQLFARNMPHTAVFILDHEARYTVVEGPFLKRLGLSPEKLIGKTVWQFASDETNKFMEPLYKRVSQGEAFTYERMTEHFAYQAYVTPLRDESGQIIGSMILTHDITEAKRAEAALHISEARFHTLVDLAPVGIIQTDVEGKRVFCNTRWCEMTGITLQEALSDINYQTIYPDDLETASSAWTNMMETHRPFEKVVFRYQRPDKTTIWVSGSGRPLYDETGVVSGYLGTVTDISESKRLEDELIKSAARYRTLIDFAPVGIVETDAQGTFVMGNARWHALSGITEEQKWVANASGTIHPDDLSRIQALHQTSVESALSIDNVEYRFIHPDGKQLWVTDSSRPLLDLNGIVTGYIVAFTDITERKRLEEALRQNEERLRLITDNIQDIVTLSDGNRRTAYISPSIRSMLGYDPEILADADPLEFVHPEDSITMPQAILSALESGVQQFTVECRLRHADGHYISTEIVGKFLHNEQSEFKGGVFVIRDITHRKVLQEMQLQKEKLQTALDKEHELSDLKSRMMERIGHEFRTPLTVIQTSTESLARYWERFTPEQRAARATRVEGQIQRITDMLDEIALVITGSFSPDRVQRISTDVSAICQDVANGLEKHFNLPDKYALNLPETAFVSLDPQVFRNALMHIMRNAARFSKPSDVVTVTLSRLEKGIELRVADTGVGILPHEQPRIFDPLFRGSNVGEISGVGVGLTIARAAIAAHGGTIIVQSLPGEGTTVTISIPG